MRRYGVRVVFTAPNELARLCRKVNTSHYTDKPCEKKHVRQFVDCKSCVVYCIPLSCKKCYIGQTGRCINDRLREHSNSLKGSVGSHIAVHCHRCGCTPLFEQCHVLGRYRQQKAGEIFEAFCIVQHGEDCISVPSISLHEKEILYLSN